MTEPTTTAGLIHDATTAALSDPSLATHLSPQAILLGQVVATTIAGATGASKPSEVALALLNQVVSQLASNLAESAMKGIETVPVIGTFVNALIGGITRATSETAAGNAHKEAESFAVRDAAEKFFHPVKTFIDGTRPCDMLADYDLNDAYKLGGTFRPASAASGSYVVMPGYAGPPGGADARYNQPRPLIGTALIMATEGGEPGQLFLTQGTSDQEWLDYDAWCARVRSAHASVLSVVGPGHAADVAWMKSVGVPKARRAVYRKLRLAIVAQRKNPEEGVDGGTSLWPIVQDMLRIDYDAGRLSTPAVSLLAAGGYSPQGHNGFGWPGTARMLQAMVDDWELVLEPWDAAGKDAQEMAREEALVVASEMGPANRLVGLSIAISSSPRPHHPRVKLNPF